MLRKIIFSFLVGSAVLAISGCPGKVCKVNKTSMDDIKERCEAQASGYCKGTGCSEVSGHCVFDKDAAKKVANCGRKSESTCEVAVDGDKLCEWK